MQYTSHLLMIEPVNFGFNPETAVNNSFQANPGMNIQKQALEEFHDLVNLLQKNNVDVTVIRDTADPFTPDSIFPNNWISFHEDGSVFLYPMYAPNRRNERKQHILEKLERKFHFTNIHDLSHYENQQLFLEGTGSMILDREHRIVYACTSPRTDIALLNMFCSIKNYQPVSFSAKDIYGDDIYHTNVMMCVGNRFAVICLESVRDNKEKEKLINILGRTNKEIIDITMDQLDHFAGNMLQVKNITGELLLVMSTQAYNSLTFAQVSRLSRHSRIIHCKLDNIERTGGGSARCMMAEIFNRPK